MPASGSFSDAVKQQADIVRIVGDYVKLKKSGAQNFSGLCPFHQEKSPSFSVHATRQFYHCFGCGVSGDVFSFVQKIENITFPEAVRAIAQKLDIPLPRQQYDSPVEAREARQRTVLLQMHEKACAFFQDQLRRPEGAGAREYLAGRGLTEEVIRDFRIGYAPDSGFVLRDRMKGEFDEDSLRASGLFSWKQQEDSARDNASTQSTAARQATPARAAAMYSRFRDRITFPICNESGRVIAFTGRRLAADDKAGPKYLNSPETPIYSKSRVLFNLDKAKEAIRKLDYAILVEGQMDCISVSAAGFHNVIASSGTAFTEPQARLLARYSKNLVVNFDPDTAGATATERTLALLVQEDFNIKVLTLESGLDPDLFIRRRGAEGYGEALGRSQKYFGYLIERARAQFSARTPEAKVKALNYLLPHVQRVPSRIVRDELAADIAQKLGIDSAVLRQELKQAATQRSGPVKSPAESQLTDAERIIVRALAPGNAAAADVRVHADLTLRSELLHHGMAGEALIEALLLGAAASDPAALTLSEPDRRLLAGILMREDEELTLELVTGALEALRRRGLERRQREIRSQIADAERKQDNATLAALMNEKLRIDRALADRRG
jgi:DNA primase